MSKVLPTKINLYEDTLYLFDFYENANFVPIIGIYMNVKQIVDIARVLPDGL